MTQTQTMTAHATELVRNPTGASRVVLVCEHASSHIPIKFNGLGLSEADRISHAAWDPGAMGVAEAMAQRLDAGLVAAKTSRLVYDCNRPPDATDAMPVRSEVIDVPGNRGLSAEDKAARVQAYYHPFRDALRKVVNGVKDPVIVTIHSFTPTYHGETRGVEIGILHDTDTRLADAMLRLASSHTTARVERNSPYGPDHGVTHTLQEHALPGGHLNVMLEVRNDLIETVDQQTAMAKTLTDWVVASCADLGVEGVQCQA